MNIGFISTRLAGTDGVSLETAKLASILRRLGHAIFYCAGEFEDDVPGLLAPEFHFTDPVAVTLGQRAFGTTEPDPTLIGDIEERAQVLMRLLRQFCQQYAIEYVIAQNIFAIPMQLPLAQALASLLAETGLPGLAHNHDLYWERDRFQTNCIPEFLDTYFPPALPQLKQATINSLAQQALKQRRGLDSILIPNIFDFDTPPSGLDADNADFRQAIGLGDEDWLILQPTRVIPRKGIELSIELLARLNNPRAKLVLTHKAGDEGLEYLHELQTMAEGRGVDLRYVADRVGTQRGVDDRGRKLYSLWDTYPHADIVTYPSLIEGFGNALLETIYFRLPALVNRYAVYTADIGPLGFQFAEIEGVITDETVATVRYWLENPASTRAIVAHNYRLAQEHFSYQTLTHLLQRIILMV